MISIYQDHYTKPVRFSNDKFYLIIPNYIFIFLDKIKEIRLWIKKQLKNEFTK